MASFPLHVDSLDLNNNNQLIVGLSSLDGNTWNGGLQLLNALDGKILKKINLNTGIIQSRFIKNSNKVACSCDDGTIKLFGSTELQLLVEWTAHDNIISSISSSEENSSLLLSSSWNGDITLWDINSKRPATLDIIPFAHSLPIYDCAFKNNSSSIFGSCGQDGFFRLWDYRLPSKSSNVLISSHSQPLSCLEFDRNDGNQVYVGTEIGEIGVIDIRNSSQPMSITSSIHQARIRRIKSIPNHHNSLLSCGDDTRIILSKAQLVNNQVSLEPLESIDIHSDFVTDIAIDLAQTNPLLIFSGSLDKTVRVSTI